MGLQAGFTAALHTLYPPQCLCCEALVTTDFGLCGPCWRDTPFIAGLVCDQCGTPLPGDEAEGTRVHCDDCLRIARPWMRGRAAMIYGGNARKMVLALKHGDRQDLARPAGQWLWRAAAPILAPDMLVAPVPLHWLRLVRRRYNQSALLAASLARQAGFEQVPDLLQRIRRTASQDGRDRDARFRNIAGALRVTPRHARRVQGRHILLVDDVMTSGATLAAGTEALLAAGATAVDVVVLARVAKDG